MVTWLVGQPGLRGKASLPSREPEEALSAGIESVQALNLAKWPIGATSCYLIKK